MFNSFKDKLKNWLKKAENESEDISSGIIEKEIKIEKREKKAKEKKETVNKKQTKTEEKSEKKQPKLKNGLSDDKFEELFEELELILLENNVSYEVVLKIKDLLKQRIVGENKKVNLEKILKEVLNEILIEFDNLIELIKKSDKPYVILFVGINGCGKTTTLSKLAYLLLKNKLSVCFAAADTFRAASIEQLQFHADKLNVPLIKKDYGSDPASVGYDAINYARKNKIDVVLIDTAGRMNNRDSLMKEIEKIARVNKPNLKIFLGESITGNDATRQAKDFNDAVGIDGIILSKADVDSKGGAAISVSHVTQKPIFYLGIGQNYSDLKEFKKQDLIDNFFS
ncbi:MAG: signal recognition particle-docking protein FtsY [Candidatus Nanoarchaeia archaeon]|nr:signal recognition particle-docking protein FtsY [Candidatus Nanoarchaeia archaeon]MDD3993647.1 signal recognition particle-docking protein FtsY [Candidatus Nanoarchaeia archaeon]